MVWVYIISAFLFTLGNVFWPTLGDPGYYYVPLSLFLLAGVFAVRNPTKKFTERQYVFLDWILLMACGNVIKQIWYTDNTVQEINDYWWGGFLAIFFIPKVIYPKIYLKLLKFIKEKWAIIWHILKKLLKRG